MNSSPDLRLKHQRVQAFLYTCIPMEETVVSKKNRLFGVGYQYQMDFDHHVIVNFYIIDVLKMHCDYTVSVYVITGVIPIGVF